MKHTTFTCDRCGKEIYGNEDDIPHLSLTNARYSVKTEVGTLIRYAPKEYDLCPDCLKEIIVDLNKLKANTNSKWSRKINEIIEENK